MESSAFPNKIIKMKLMKLKVDEYYLCLLKLCKNAAICMSFRWKHQKNTLFYFDCYLKGNSSIKNHSRKKTLPRRYTKTTHQRYHSKMYHLGIPAGQTNSVKLSIFC